MTGVGEADRRRVNGFRHDLIAALARFRGWSVHEHEAAAGAMPCRGQEVYELLGTADIEDGRIRMVVLLRRHCDGHYVWSEEALIDVGNWYPAKQPVIRAVRRGARYPGIGGASGDCRADARPRSRHPAGDLAPAPAGRAQIAGVLRAPIREREARRFVVTAAKLVPLESRSRLTSG